ncbi:MAG: bifunctional 23S rRNA (guanine(2069)-N(7))-methyltransferase RlmK/23S rRNA (guanine(2445)-N(2))-methyltransferase RlmL [Desulfuromonadales bacterium]|nr:bifunctional 23S rRNA (guanine(2069)-N(7))-methyltransferase RlmK/23S rRNA (guanine(2445)-N(2))-methyltransferase RlmL [Desulfuromonadales bacterium]NIS40715.1 bifunctional 23S rRNA (guanine(2069)-N(7))-methyltransferase RlmK/23S rRNA (guanine(2445)-N(2))-methyltransferase RlmL [Desulfuromonadales bacterium]
MDHREFDFFATTGKGMEGLLAAELRRLDAEGVSETRSGAHFRGPLAIGYRACLWSRLANRILLPLSRFPAETPEALYEAAKAVPWAEHMEATGSLAVDAVLNRSQITHSHFAALKVKDAVVDYFRERHGDRPEIDLQRPDMRLNLHIDKDEATLSLDLSGGSLHQRGYRSEALEAPMKETLAAAILQRAGWAEIAASGGSLVDPMCGSGTLPIEAALIAGDIAPGLSRERFGFFGWHGHDPDAWEGLLEEARERREKGLTAIPRIAGFDHDPRAIRIARSNAAGAGLEGVIRFERRDLEQIDGPLPDMSPGLVVTNPPYGERLGEFDALKTLYRQIGESLRRGFEGWRAAIITSETELGRCLGLRARKSQTVYNGALACRLLHFDIAARWYFREVRGEEHRPRPLEELGEGAQMFANRLRKNLKTLGRWARRNDIGCYRLYDADMPEYAVAVDLYEDHVHVQEYQAPKSVDAEKARLRLREVMAVLPQVLDVPSERIHLKVRRRQKGAQQYGKIQGTSSFFEVSEGPARYLVNLDDYLDTGLFLDHRPIREQIRRQAAGKHFLNLFAYTGTATVCAALGDAASTTTVDMSRTYLDWALRNMQVNGFGRGPHRYIQADCLAWLGEESAKYDLIFLDPPTFSNSKRMDGTLDVQRDHVEMIRTAVGLLAPGGELIFSNNNRRFRLDEKALSDLEITDITSRSIPRDFQRNPRIHVCYSIRHRPSSV